MLFLGLKVNLKNKMWTYNLQKTVSWFHKTKNDYSIPLYPIDVVVIILEQRSAECLTCIILFKMLSNKVSKTFALPNGLFTCMMFVFTTGRIHFTFERF